MFTIQLDGCSIKVTPSDEGVVVDILSATGKRITGTWASIEEITSERRIDRAVPSIVSEGEIIIPN